MRKTNINIVIAIGSGVSSWNGLSRVKKEKR